MPPKPSVSKDEISEAAFTIVCQEGMQSLTARYVAQKMGLSTRPIYFYFSSMKDLQKEAMRKAREILRTYISKTYTERVFLNIGIGLVFYARDHKMLYRLMFLESSDFKDIVNEFLISMRPEMKKDQRFKDMTQKERDDLLDKMWIFTHGLASLICTGLIEDDSDTFIIDTIDRMGSVVVAAAISESHNRKRRSHYVIPRQTDHQCTGHKRTGKKTLG